jgi:hypothetical protein
VKQSPRRRQQRISIDAGLDHIAKSRKNLWRVGHFEAYKAEEFNAPSLMFKQRRATVLIQGTQGRDIGRRDFHLFAEVFEQFGRHTLECVERSATHRDKSELQCYAESQCVFLARSNGAMNRRFEREESGYLKFRQFGGKMPPTQIWDLPGQHDTLLLARRIRSMQRFELRVAVLNTAAQR